MRVQARRLRAALLSLLAAGLLTAVAPAQAALTLRVGSGTAAPGTAVSVDFSITGDGVGTGADLRASFSAALGVPTTQNLNGGSCAYNATTPPRVSAIYIDLGGNPIAGTRTICRATFNVPAATAPGNYALTIFESNCSDTLGNPQPCTLVNGSITVAAGTPPTLSYTPAPPTQIDLPGGALNAQVTSAIDIQAIGGSGIGRVDLDCSTGGAFSLPAGGTRAFPAGAAPATVAVRCTLGAAPQNGNLTCFETDTPGGASRIRSWPLRCPTGTAATVVAPLAVGNRGGLVAADVSAIGDGTVHSFAGDMVFDPAVLTPTQIAGTNGATCFVRPAPNDNRIAVSVPAGPAPLPLQQTPYCRVAFLVESDAALGSSALTLASTTCLNGSNAPVTCFTQNGGITVSGFDSSPRPGTALALTALPSQNTVSGSILAINFGATAIDVASCTPEPATGYTVTPSGAFSIAATNFRTIGVECTPPALGAPPLVSDLGCVLQDTTPPRVVRYRLVCSRASGSGPIAGSSLAGTGTAAGDEVGAAVASTVTAGGEEVLVVGAPFAGVEDGGRAFVIVRPAGSGPLGASAKRATASLVHDPLDLATAHALSATTAIGDKFGIAVAVDPAGDPIAIGAPGAGATGAGRVHVFAKPMSGWGPLDTPSYVIEAPRGPAAADTVPDEFGAQVGFAANGTLLVGAPLADVGAGAADAGAAYAYAPGGSAPTAILRSPQVETGAGFGSAIAIDANAVAIGAPLENVDGDADQGAVYVMPVPGAPVEPTRRVTATGGGIGDKFGQSVAFTDRMLVVGTPGDDTAAGTDAGSATLFTGDAGTGFDERMTLAPSGGSTQQAGTAVATNGDVILVGAPFATVEGRSAQGRVFSFDVPENLATMPAETPLDGIGGQPGDRFGSALATSARRLLVGVPKDDNELGIAGTSVQVDEGRADPFLFDRILRAGFE